MIVEIKSIGRTIDFTIPDNTDVVTSEFYNNKIAEALEISQLVGQRWDENNNNYLDASELLFIVGFWQFVASCHQIIAIKNNLIMPEIVFDDFFNNENTIEGFSWRFPLRTGEYVAEDALGNSHVYIRVVCESSPYLNTPDNPILDTDEYRYYMEQDIPIRDVHIIASAFPFGSKPFGNPETDLMNVVMNMYPVVDCFNNCTGNCTADCTGSCENTCRGKCSTSCSGSCSGGCWSCEGTCNAVCADTCQQGDCYRGCTVTCGDDCYNSCKGGSSCELGGAYQQTVWP